MGQPAERMYGVVKWFDNKKGFGFILDHNNNEYFVHYSAIAGTDGGYRSLHESQAVTFTPANNEKGPRALDVQSI
jgi:CspA family cold shock protein